MILRKPYAILIKYFKVIHILMFILFVYLVFALRKIYMFFANYIDTSSYVYQANMAKIYVPWILVGIVLILLILAISILLLMRKKEKPVLFYKIMIAYCSILVISLIYFIVFFNSLDKATYEPLRMVVNRDISLFVYLFNFFFVIFTFIRGFGFDIKKFSFDRDKKELHLEESDSEEYELNVGVEKADVKTFLNRHKREFTYYIKQNKKILIIILVIAILSIGSYLYYDLFVENKVYHEKETVSTGNVSYYVNSSIISNIDKYGQYLDDDSDYLIVNMNITNNGSAGYLDSEALRVHIDEKDYFYPTSLCSMFSDLGECYSKQQLKTGVENNYIFVYKINKVHQNIDLEILKGKGDEYKYSKVKLSALQEDIKEIESEEKEFEINNQKYQISDYKIYEKTSYKYEECISSKCNTYTKMVIPNVGDVILALEIEGVDNISDEILDSAFGIKYHLATYSGKVVKFVAKNGNMVYFSAPSFLKTQSNFTLTISTRGMQYNMVFVGGLSE